MKHLQSILAQSYTTLATDVNFETIKQKYGFYKVYNL